MKLIKSVLLTLVIFTMSFTMAHAQYGGSSSAQTTAPNIVELVTSNDDFSTLAMLLTEAGLVETVRDAEALTVFAPTNAAFALVPEETLQALLADLDLLRTVLLTHVVGGAVASSAVVQVQEVTTLADNVLPVVVTNGSVRIGNATVVTVDVMASNGIVHIVDSVIMPPAAE